MIMFSYTSLTVLKKKQKKNPVLLNPMLVCALPLCKLIWIRAKKEAAKENDIVSATFMLSTVTDKLQMGKKGREQKNLRE